jgi:hypothetical protein
MTSLKTRLDSRSEGNSSFQIKSESGALVAEIELIDTHGAILGITTVDNAFIEKPSGWTSLKEET